MNEKEKEEKANMESELDSLRNQWGGLIGIVDDLYRRKCELEDAYKEKYKLWYNYGIKAGGWK